MHSYWNTNKVQWNLAKLKKYILYNGSKSKLNFTKTSFDKKLSKKSESESK